MYNAYPYPYYLNRGSYNPGNIYNIYSNYPCPYYSYDQNFSYDENFDFSRASAMEDSTELRDYGPEPFVVNINEATIENDTYRTALWTGSHLQLTLMSLNVGEDIGLEMHADIDQFLRIEEGEGIVRMGASRDNLNFEREVYDDFVILIPAGTWHNLINTGSTPLKVYSIYAPPQHPHGTVHETKAEAEAAEQH